MENNPVGKRSTAPPTGQSSPAFTSFPLVVDLDGTLIHVDTLVESAFTLIRQSPMNLLRMALWLMKGKAELKEQVSRRVELPVAHLPYRQAVIDYLQAQSASGRRLVLATAANSRIAEAVAEHTKLFEDVLSSDATTNLRGARKLSAIKDSVGEDFVYAGDSRADLAVWRHAAGAILVAASPRVASAARKMTEVEVEFPLNAAGPFVWLRALRVHQWLKNMLLFVPLFTAFGFSELRNILVLLVAFASFSMLASATYILNDLWDLDSDRRHPRKRLRPFASGVLSPLQGLLASAGLFVCVGVTASFVSWQFAASLLTYLVMTSVYSLSLKSYVLLDILMLSCLYTLRIIAGGIAIGVALSNWLLAFSAFFFLSLALVKRCAELVALEETGDSHTRGRDYRVSDLRVLWPLGVGSSVASVVVFGLFVNSPETSVRYLTPHFLWLVAAALVYWLGRLWIKTSRGEMHDDPIVYAVKDRPSLLVGAFTLACVLVAKLCAAPIPFLLQ